MKHTKFVLLAIAALLAGCSMIGPIDTSLGNTKPLVRPLRESAQMMDALVVDKATPPEPVAQNTQFFKVPITPSGIVVSAQAPSVPTPVPNANDETVSAVTLDGIPLPQFINTIYATVLKRNVSVDPAILSRTDLVSLRTGKPQSASQLSAAAQMVLKSYGVSINEFEGLVRAVPSAGVGGASAEILRGRAQPDIPGSLRPIFYLMELDNTSQASAVTWVRTLFQGRVTVSEDPPRNAIMLSGQSDSVMAAVDAIHSLDKPGMRGRYSARITPVFWSATEIATRLVDILTAQGYSASTNVVSPSPILILPIAPINSLVVFAVSEEALNHTLRWARELDQTPPTRSGGRYITYYVRNTDAGDVAKTLQEVLGGSATTQPVAAGVAPAARPSGGSKVVVNAVANSIIIQSSPAEYQQIYSLLQELDRPARSALIMATVAEVVLSEDEQFGFNWLLSQFNSGGYIVNGGMGPAPISGTVSSAGIALNIASIAGDPRALLTALATSSKVRVLSNPSVVTVSGQLASIQVGQDVPVTSGTYSNSSTGGGIVTTTQYRNVGVILRVKPTIRAGGRIDLEISQEVSGVATVATATGVSPTINTRRVETKLATSDGNTMLIGGLISEQREGLNAGIPYLKDIPLVGGLFRTKGNRSSTRTELVLLITPYVMEDDFDSRALTEAFRGQFTWGGDLAVSTKEPAKLPVTVLGAPSGAQTIERVGEPYKLPLAQEVDVRSKLKETTTNRGAVVIESPLEAAGARPPVATPFNAAKPFAPLGQGKEVTDEKLRQELLDAVRGGKK